MKKPTFKRLLLGMVQHLIAMIIFLSIMILVVNSRIRIQTDTGRQYYRISPFDKLKQFEDTSAFQSMLHFASQDLITLMVLKGQMETNGVFDGNKEIDCTEFANRKGSINFPITAYYRLDDLIKWGKSGIEIVETVMTKSEFVTYYDGDILDISNFYIDDLGELQFAGFVNSEEIIMDYSQKSTERFIMSEDEFSRTYGIYSVYSREKLIDIIFKYLQQNMQKEITLKESEDGTPMVQVPLLKCKYLTSDEKGYLLTRADNWIDYAKLEENVITTINDILYNYDQYNNRKDLYKEDSSIRYVFHMKDDNAIEVMTNLDNDLDWSDEQIVTDYFDTLDYFINYSLKDLTFSASSRTGISSDDLFQMIRTHEYAYPENTKIWIGVDINTSAKKDPFAVVKNVYEKIVPNIWKYVTFLVLCVLVWLIIWNYLSITAGRAMDMDGYPIHYLNWFDKIYTELALLIGILFAFIGVYGAAFLLNIGESYYIMQGESYILGNLTERAYEFGLAALYGFMASFTFSIMWYSLVRRIKGKSLWKASLLHKIVSKLYYGCAMVFRNKNIAIRTLLPYTLFLLINLLSLALVYVFRHWEVVAMLCVLAILSFDGLIGIMLFRINAERFMIVDGINQIRQGEVNYKLETENLHGENREMAEAVNNIGEGIRNAVETSMKDERMKTDLITNVSHDIKTPLTSIINYVDLLKREKIENQTAKSYIEILEAKAQRLKVLTDDLVEVSRISSGNIILVNEKLNLTELVNQSLGEFSEKFEQRNLQTILNDSETPAYIYADSRRMWRVMENLFNNICKYAMPSTRIYLDLLNMNHQIELSIKNISEHQLNISPEELTERFIRGDVSRTTEGSGLGLSIVQNLINVQGGQFRIQLDGDLFKVIICFPEYVDMQTDKSEEVLLEMIDNIP